MPFINLYTWKLSKIETKLLFLFWFSQKLHWIIGCMIFMVIVFHQFVQQTVLVSKEIKDAQSTFSIPDFF